MTVRCPKCDSENTDTARFCSNCATSLQPSEDIPVQTKTIEAPREELTTGSTFAGRYQIIEELGRGGMGRVYKAQDTEIKEKIALKLIKPEISSDRKTIERFQNELKLARKISHRNVCRMHHLEKSEGNYFITMEYVDGENLKGMIRMMGQLSSGKAISIAKQVCEGLSEAHRIGVVHRDLKPSNIMIDKDGNAKIMDFGIARSLTGKEITGVGVMIGTSEYMSPEQVESKEIDQRSDIYSLGVILYEMVTGRVPFEGDTPYSIGVKHKSELPRNPKEINPQISDDLNRMILKCLEKEKDKRYQSAGELRSELENIEKGMPTTDRVIPERKPLTSKEITVTFGLKKLLVPAMAVVAVIIIAVIIWKPWSRQAPTPLPTDKPSLAIMYFENNSGEENLDNWRSGLCEMLITDMSQSKFINVISGDQVYSILEKFDLLDKEKYSTEELMTVARQAGVNHVMRGNYITAGDKFIINVSILKADSGEVVSSIKEEGIGEGSITGSVDKITREIKSVLNISPEQIASDIDEAIGKVTTNSPEALRYFIQGRKHYLRSEPNQCINFMEKAVEIDPEFSMAYILLSNSWGNLGFYEKRLFFAKKAFEFKERLTEREFYRIQAYYYRRQQIHDKAIESFETLIRLYPDELMAYNSVGLSYSDTGQWEKAIERFNYLIEKKYESRSPYANLASVYRRLGEYDKAREVLQYYLNNVRDDSGVRRGIASAYISEGNLEKALFAVEETLSIYPADFDSYRQKGHIYQYMNEIGKAEECFQKLIELNEPRQLSLKDDGFRGFADLRLQEGKYKEAKDWITRGLDVVKTADEISWGAYSHAFLAYLNLKLEKIEDAFAECEKALDIAIARNRKTRQLLALTYRGLGYLKAHSETEARQTADELKAQAEEELPEANMKYYFLLEGMIDLKKGNTQGALANFKRAKSLLNHQSYAFEDEHALIYEALASAYYESGNLELAYQEYKEIISLTDGRLLFGDIYAKSFYMLGKIYKQQGNTAKAIENYEKFLDLWKNADPGISEVEDAKERLAGLKGQ